MQSFTRFLSEGVPDERLTTITIKCRDLDHSLENLLKHIQKAGNVGHSFRIVVDPDYKEETAEFGWDGDGSDYIQDIKVKKPENVL
jgi:hypothetical protein